MLDSQLIKFVAFVGCSAIFVLCDTLAANWGKNNSFISLAGVVILAPFGYILFGYLNKTYPLSIVSAWVFLGICLTTMLIGVLFFNDHLSWRQGVGLVFTIIAIVFLVS